MKDTTIRAKILKMKSQGHSAREIAEHLNSTGVKTPHGKTFKEKSVFAIVYRVKKQGKTADYVGKARTLLGADETTEATANSDILGLLDSQRYTDRQKIEAVKALLR